MKRSKRQESSIVIYFSFYFILLLALIIFSLSTLYPKVRAIEEKKETTNTIFKDLKALTSNWIAYWEFKKLSTESVLNSYQKELISSVGVDFYNNNFKNNTTEEYLLFLEQKKNKLNNEDEIEKFKQKEKQIIKLLPAYSESDITGKEELLSDYKFINYIDNILATFALKYDNEIWISDLILVEEFSETWKKSKLDTDIYYIPLTLSLEWTKYNIINFLYFIEHVWNINISENSLNIYSQNNDNFLNRWDKWVKILLKHDQPKLNNYTKSYIDNYNIFENQLIDIKSIEFSEYLDSFDDPNIQDKTNIATRVKNAQWNEKMTIDIELHFYVKWVQNIKIIEHLKLYIDYFMLTKKLVASQMKDKNLNTVEKNIAKVLQADLNEMTKTLKDINISISKQENLNDTLRNVTNYINNLHAMHAKLWYNIYIKWFLIEYKKLLANDANKTWNIVLYNYLISIEKTIEGLNKKDIESFSTYNSRLNNKKLFQNVLQIQKNIDLKK